VTHCATATDGRFARRKKPLHAVVADLSIPHRRLSRRRRLTNGMDQVIARQRKQCFVGRTRSLPHLRFSSADSAVRDNRKLSLTNER